MHSALRISVFAILPNLLMAQSPSVLAQNPSVKSALDAVKRNEPRFIEEQIRICEIPAPPFNEQVRGREMERLFRQLGLQDVRIDKAGNVLGTRPGTSPKPHVVLAAHLDTVFPPETPVRVTRQGQLLKGPGISDDCRGLAAMLGVIQAMKDANVTTPGTITFVADVGEEGLGDLRGMKELFGTTLKGSVDKFVSIDGSHLGISNVGVGSYRYRVTFKGPGGHSFTDFGHANPIQAMGRAIAMIDAIQVPSAPRATFNVGRVGGGTSINSIPFESWMEVDMRSSNRDALETLHAKIKAAVQDAVTEENRRWNQKGAVSVKMDVVGVRPAGNTPGNSSIVQAALEASRIFGSAPQLIENSTDANLPMSLGIPAITIGGGGIGADAHALTESFDPIRSYLGTQRALLLIAALAR